MMVGVARKCSRPTHGTAFPVTFTGRISSFDGGKTLIMKDSNRVDEAEKRWIQI